MKIMMVIDNMSLGGAQKMFAFLANELVMRGNDVYLISYSTGVSFFTLHAGVHFIGGSELNGNRVLRHLKKIPFIKQNLKQVKPSIVIAFSTIPAVLSKLASIGMSIPVIFCERGDPYQYSSIIERAKIKTVSFCDFFVFQTEAARNYYPKRVRVNSCVIPNPVTDVFFDRVHYSCRNRNIVFVGRFDLHQKRQDVMVDAFSIVAKKHDDVNLVFYGDGDDLQKVKNLVKKERLEEKVVFKGKVKNIKEEIKDSLLYVISSDFEGIPNSLIEAMSLGLPCISTDCSPGGARVLIRDNENGIIVPCDNPAKLADAIDYLIENPRVADEMGKKAQQIIEEFNPNKIISMWLDMIKKVVDKC